MSNPDLDLAPQVSFAKDLLQWFTGHIQEDPAYEARLKRHYLQVKEADSNPTHPAYKKYQAWMTDLPLEDRPVDDELPKPTQNKPSH